MFAGLLLCCTLFTFLPFKNHIVVKSQLFVTVCLPDKLKDSLLTMLKGTVMQIEIAMINYRLRVLNVS